MEERTQAGVTGRAGTGSLRLLRRSYRFLQREQARKAWLIFALSVAFAALPWTAHLSGIRQGAIVLASLAAGGIFMPELNSGLWRFKAEEIRDTIPEHKRRAFYTELIKADCPADEWAQRWAVLAWQQGVIPLLQAAQQAGRIHWNVNYQVSVHLGQNVRVGRREQLMAWVETSNDYERILPPGPGPLWVSIAGNEASLLAEFGEDNCLSRELVALPDLTGKAWASEVRRLCRVQVRIGPRTITFNPDSIVTVPGDEDHRIVRWLIPLTQDEARASSTVACQVEIHFPTVLRENKFPVVLAGYYCAERTVLSFKLYHGSGTRPLLRYFDEFLSAGSAGSAVSGASAAWAPQRFDTSERQSVTYSTSRDSLLWPGSGIYYWWEHDQDEVAD